MELAPVQQVGGCGPQHDGGEGLVGEPEVTPQHPKGNEVQGDAHDKQRDGNHQAVLVRALIIAEGVSDGQAGRTEGRIAGCHGQHHNAEDGEGAAKRAEQLHGNVVHDQSGVPLGAEGGVKGGGIRIEGHAERYPDEPDNAFRNHRAIKNLPSMLFVADAAGHQRGLRGVEAGAGAASDGDEHQRPSGQAGGVLRRPFNIAVEGVSLEGQSSQQADRHEHQQYGEERIDAPDDLVHGQNRGEEVVGKDDRHKKHAVDACQLGQQASGPRHEDHAHQNEQHDGEHAHELPDGFAKVISNNVGHGLAVITDRQHP